MPYYQRNILVLSTTIFLATLSWQQVMPFLSFFLEDLGASNPAAWTCGVFAAQALAFILAMPLWGKLADTLGRKPMIIRAGVCLVGIYFGMSYCTAPWHVLVFRFLNGALTGFIPSSFALIATNTPQDKAPRFMATAQTAGALGSVIGPPIGGLLADQFGYRGSMRVSGLAVLISVLLVWWFVKEPNKARDTEKTSILEDLRTAARSRVLSSVLFAALVSAVLFSAIGPVLALHLKRIQGGGPQWIAGMVFALPAVAFMVSAHWWSRAGERWGYRRVIMLGLLGGGIGALLLAPIGNIWVFALIYFACGLLMASVSPAIGAIICLRVDETFRGRAYTMQQASGVLGALLALLGGLYVGKVFGTPGIFVMSGILMLLGAIAYRIMATGKQQGGKTP